MGYLYKLIDEAQKIDAQLGLLSLSHPVFEFQGSEGKIIDFVHRIYDKYKNGKKELKIKPSQKDLVEINEWINIFKSTYGTDFKDNDIISESKILFCGIMQGYCGYYTYEDLENKDILEKYLSNNNYLRKNKSFVLKIDDSILNHKHWRTSDITQPFKQFNGKEDGFNGFLHLENVVYTENYNNYNLLKEYNRDEIRHSSSWFTILSSKFECQKEKRIVFLLRSLEKNSIRLGCDRIYSMENVKSYEEIVYCNIVDAIDYCQKKSPRYIYLDIGNKNLNLKPINEILNQ